MNIYEVGYIYFHQDPATLKMLNRKRDNYFADNYFLGFLNFFLKFLYSLIFCKKKFPQISEKYQGILAYGLSRNNRVTLLPIIEKVGKEKIALFVDDKKFPAWRLYWYSVPHLHNLITEIRKADPQSKKVIKYLFPKFWRMYGCEKVAGQMLDKYSPKVVLLSNDHLEFNRCLLFEAKKRNIKTVYVQHAAVAAKFPPLSFSYSLLDGEDALQKYRIAGPLGGNIYLLGGVRFDAVNLDIKKQVLEKSIGVAINLVDKESKVKEFCLALKSELQDEYSKVVLRPHPQMLQNGWKEWCESNGVGYSSPFTESSFDFICKSSLVVANQCSIHLDACMCRTPSIVYDMSDNGPKDVYGFVEKGLVTVADNINDVEEFAKSLSSWRPNTNAIKYYNYSYDTKYEGKVSEFIAKLIDSILHNNQEDFNLLNGFSEVEVGNNYVIYGQS